MEQLLNVLQQNGEISGWFIVAFNTATELDLVNLINGLALLSVFLLGNAFWQATERMKTENRYLIPMIESIYSWRTDSLLLTYLSLLVLLIGLTTIIANTVVADYTFWVGNTTVILSQMTVSGKRLGIRLVQGSEGLFKLHKQSNPITSTNYKRAI